MVVDAAYAACQRLARRHAENFPVASRLLPRAMRRHVAAIYAFARTADDFADEGVRPDAERIALLDDWQARLDVAAQGQVAAAEGENDSDACAVFTAVGETLRRLDLDPGLLADLLSAFRQDVRVKRYETWDHLNDYCRRSANPIGRLVLGIAGVRDAAVLTCSDTLCTALQLTNFWQDLAVDWRRGRLYVPMALVRASGADQADLDRGLVTAPWRTVLAQAAAHTRALYAGSRAIGEAVGGRLGWELRATWLGGRRILDRVEAAGFDVFRARPSLGWRDAPSMIWGTVRWPRNADASR